MKHDGYRVMAAVSGDQVRIFTRNGHDWTQQFGYLAPAFRKLTILGRPRPEMRG